MATFSAEGTLWIDLVDVYAWLKAGGYDVTPGHRLVFSVEDDGLQILQGDATRTVDAPELWSWVLDHQVPASLKSVEIRFGVPKIVGGEMVITYAAGGWTAPEGWSPPPACLAEWKRTS